MDSLQFVNCCANEVRQSSDKLLETLTASLQVIEAGPGLAAMVRNSAGGRRAITASRTVENTAWIDSTGTWCHYIEVVSLCGKTSELQPQLQGRDRRRSRSRTSPPPAASLMHTVGYASGLNMIKHMLETWANDEPDQDIAVVSSERLERFYIFNFPPASKFRTRA
jgi:uncharacterized protein YjaZ